MNRAPNWDQRDEGLGNFDDYGEDLSQGRRGYKGRGKGRDRDGPYEKRTKLYRADQTSSTFFNPYGRAFLPPSNKELYVKVSEGDKKTMFHSELCAGEGTGGNYRVGIGLSRTAECLLAAFAELRSDNLKKIINPHYYDQAMQDIEKLTPHLKVTLRGGLHFFLFLKVLCLIWFVSSRLSNNLCFFFRREKNKTRDRG